MNDWKAIQWDEASMEEPPRTSRSHAFVSPKKVPWLNYCRHCGHYRGRNYISRLVTKIGCDFERDARFVAWRKNPSAFVDRKD